MATTPNANDSPLEDLNDFRRDVLTVLDGMDEPSGQQIKEKLETFYSQDVTHGRLYPALNDLEEMGLIHKGEVDRRTNYYEATSRGRRELSADIRWRHQMAGVLDD
ncbi:PadR family transcriptional regulator [Natrialba aegyptia]|uniref:PadR family transcriptional regulator n=1 Tax=Natrialba aegyptia TaxID=129789 RepID=UPI00403B03A2